VAGAGGAVVGGGVANLNTGMDSVIVGGISNYISGPGSFIGGGGYDGDSYVGNFIGGYASTIGGGLDNSIPTGPGYAVIGGGADNYAAANYAAIGGGSGNYAAGEWAVVPGGDHNQAIGAGSLAAGTLASAGYAGSFVWADSTANGVQDSGPNQFVARASGGFYFYTSGGGAKLASGATSWTTLCDRSAKKNFKPVDTEAVLDKLAAVPIEQWNYKWEKDGDVPNIGPMAQDFIAAFYPGRDDKGITTLQFDGVELAAIQGLNQKIEKQQVELKQKEAEVAELKARLEKLEQLLLKQKPN
jgi:hypothetical protein